MFGILFSVLEALKKCKNGPTLQLHVFIQHCYASNGVSPGSLSSIVSTAMYRWGITYISTGAWKH